MEDKQRNKEPAQCTIPHISSRTNNRTLVPTKRLCSRPLFGIGDNGNSVIQKEKEIRGSRTSTEIPQTSKKKTSRGNEKKVTTGKPKKQKMNKKIAEQTPQSKIQSAHTESNKFANATDC